MDHKKLFYFALDVGEVMLKNGAETSRVEDTISRIFSISDYETTEAFVTPTGIFATLSNATCESISHIKRVHKREVNFHKVAMANDLSRRFCDRQVTLEDAVQQLSEIRELKQYPPLLMMLAKAAGAGAFAVVYGGNIRDMLVSCIIGLAIGGVQWLFSSLGAFKFFVDVIAGMMVGLFAVLGTHYIPIGQHFDLIVVGGLMPLVPGIAITNAIRDTIKGDYLSGVSRTADAFVVAASVAVGAGVVIRGFYLLNGGGY